MEDLPQRFFATWTSDDERTVLNVGGECDAVSLEELNEALAEVVERRAGEVVVDLAKTTFIDSLALGALTAAAKRVRSAGRSFRVVRASPAVRRAFQITGLDNYLLAAHYK